MIVYNSYFTQIAFLSDQVQQISPSLKRENHCHRVRDHYSGIHQRTMLLFSSHSYRTTELNATTSLNHPSVLVSAFSEVAKSKRAAAKYRPMSLP
jgi:hypothetical protein